MNVIGTLLFLLKSFLRKLLARARDGTGVADWCLRPQFCGVVRTYD